MNQTVVLQSAISMIKSAFHFQPHAFLPHICIHTSLDFRQTCQALNSQRSGSSPDPLLAVKLLKAFPVTFEVVKMKRPGQK